MWNLDTPHIAHWIRNIRRYCCHHSVHKSNNRCTCVRKFATVTTMVAHEVSLDRPSLSNDEDPENPENEEPSFKSSRDTMSVGFYGKYESADTCALETDESPFERIQQLLLKNQKQMDDCDEEMWHNRDIFKTEGEK